MDYTILRKKDQNEGNEISKRTLKESVEDTDSCAFAPEMFSVYCDTLQKPQ